MGTTETACVEANRERYTRKPVDEVIPAIEIKRPEACQNLFSIQVNAPGHRIVDEPEIKAACSSGGWGTELANQPRNSLDTKIPDLGFFSSIQLLEDCTTPKVVAEL